MSRCAAEMCLNWTGGGCICAVFELEPNIIEEPRYAVFELEPNIIEEPRYEVIDAGDDVEEDS